MLTLGLPYDEAGMISETSKPVPGSGTPLRALCIARHSFLSEHIARYFAPSAFFSSTFFSSFGGTVNQAWAVSSASSTR